MSKPVKIEVISDVVCPWCVIGYWRLKQALKELELPNEIQIIWHPFELNPDMPIEGENLRAHLAAKYGTTLEGSINARAMLTEEGEKVGFSFNYYDDMKMLNTFDCHQLLLWAKDSGKQNALSEALFAQFFTHQEDFERTKLLELVAEVGLDVKAAKAALESQELADEVRAIESNWHAQRIYGVPLFVFNGEHVLSGAQEVSVFKQVLLRAVN